jgi:very-short-patch-repair endonuclease
VRGVVVEISHSGAKQSRDGINVRRVRLDPVDVTALRGIAVTTPARTLYDVAGSTSEALFDAALHHCLHQRLVTEGELTEIAARRSGPGFTGAARFRAAVAAYSGGPAAASPLEARVARCLRQSGLPRPERQHEVRVGGTCRYLDFAWPAHKVGLEVDGYRWHSSRAAWQRDRDRLSDLRRAGWRIVHATHDDVRRRFADVVDELAPLLR